MNCEKGYNKQLASAYIVFMIGGSYFYKCHSRSHSSRFFLHYAEMPRQKQYACEAWLAREIERLDKIFLKKLGQLQCEVIGWREKEDVIMKFYTYGFEELKFGINPDGEIQLLMSEKEQETENSKQSK